MANPQPVIYQLSLKDDLSAGVDKANEHVNKLESSLHSAQGALGALGIGFGIFAGVEFIKSGVEAMEQLHQSMAQVEAALKSTGEAGGLSFGELEESAKSLSEHLRYSRADIFGLQSLLLTFPSISKQYFEQTEAIVADMSTRLGQDLKSSAIQVGKALQDPEHGITALRRVGVNFNDTQTEVIKNLVATGHAAEAQGMILKELALEFGGSAQAAFDADPLARYKKTMEDLELTMGSLAMDVLHELVPYLEEFAHWLKEGMEWVKKNKEEIGHWVKILGEAWLVLKSLSVIVIPLAEGLGLVATAETAVAAGAAEVGVGMTAALGPIGLVAVAVTGLVALYNELAGAEERSAEQKDKLAKINETNEANDLKDMMASRVKGGMSESEAFKKTISSEREMQEHWISDLIPKMTAARKAGDNEKLAAMQQTMQGILDRKSTLNKFEADGITHAPKPLTMATTAKVDAATKPTKTQASGSKMISINVHIGNLINEFKVSTTNISDGADKIKEYVAAALISAVNDSQIIAGQ